MSSRKPSVFEDRPVKEAFFRLALPAAAGQVILVIYNMADAFFVGLTQSDAKLAAVSVCMPAYMFLSAVSNLFGAGGAAYIARCLGMRNREKARLAAAFSFWGCLGTALMYSLFVLLFKDPFADLLGGTDPAVHRGAVLYLLYTVSAGGAAASLGGLFSHMLRSEGRSFHASFGIMLGGILNILLDPLYMFVLFPKGSEVAAAAAATASAQGLSLLYYIAVLLAGREKSVLRFRPRRSMFSGRIPSGVLTGGVPACVMTLGENISYAVLDNRISLSGVAMQAGIGAAKKINMLAHSIVRGLAQGALPLIAYNFAAGNTKRMREAVRTVLLYAVSAAAACTAVCLLFAPSLSGLFIRSGTEARDAGARFLRILCIGAPFSACAYTLITFFQAVGEGKKSLLLALLRKGILDIPLIFLLGIPFRAYGPAAATPAADLISCLFACALFIIYIKPDTGSVSGQLRP